MSELLEAFQQFDALNEEAFDISTETGLQALKDWEEGDSVDDTVDIIDDEAETEEELEDSYVGKVILDCCVCHSKIYKDKEDVELSDELSEDMEEGEVIANVDEECPYCYATDGFTVVGEVAPFDEEAEEEVKAEAEDEEGNPVDVEVETEEEEKLESLRRQIRAKNAIRESLRRRANKQFNESLRVKKRNKFTESEDHWEYPDDFDEYSDDDYTPVLTSDDMNAGRWYESLRRGIREALRRMNEAEMSDEDKRDNEILRNIYIKSQKGFGGRSNARLTSEEKAVLDKYGLLRDWNGNIRSQSTGSDLFNPSFRNHQRDSARDAFEKSSEYGYVDGKWQRTRPAVTDMDSKVNLADRARKMDSRADYHRWHKDYYSRDPDTTNEHEPLVHTRWGSYPKSRSLSDADLDRAAVNYALYAPVDSMKTALDDKKRYSKALANVDSEYDAKDAVEMERHAKVMASYRKQREMSRKYSADRLATSQGTIDKLLKRNQKQESMRVSGACMDEKGHKELRESVAEDLASSLFSYAKEIVPDIKLNYVDEDGEECIIQLELHKADWKLGHDKLDDAIEEWADRNHLTILDLGSEQFGRAWGDVYSAYHTVCVEKSIENEGLNHGCSTTGEGLNCRRFGESIENIDVDTGDQVIHVSTEDKEVEDIPETGEEMIAPISDETMSDIEDNVPEEESEEESEEIDAPLDDFDEESFDELGESYLKKIYSNVESYKTNRVSTLGNKMKLEGVITFKSGSKKNTQFILESHSITKRGKVKFIGENAQITKNKKAFTLQGTLNKGKLISESLNYNYSAKDAKSGKSKRVYGTVSCK